jgi:hypothetical protein
MRKIHILGIALVAIFAFSAVVASMASAETTLLADWEIGGVVVTAETPTTAEGEIQLEDTKAKLGVTCSGKFIGTSGPNGIDLVTEVQSLTGTQVTLTAPLLCKSHKFCEESATDIEAAPEGLPWTTKAYLTEAGTFRDLTIKATYSTSCLVLGIKVSEECTDENASYELKNVTGGIEAVGAATPDGNCTTGGAGAGEVTFLAGNLLKPTAGGTITVSSN